MDRITEQESLHIDLDLKSTSELLSGINEEDAKVHAAIKLIIPEISSLVDEIFERMSKGGRLFYNRSRYKR